MTPVPKAGFEFECEIHCCNKKLRRWLDPKYYVDCPYRPTFFQEEREVVLNRFTGDQPDNNVAELTRFWSKPDRTIRGGLEADPAEVARREATDDALEAGISRTTAKPAPDEALPVIKRSQI